jgi:hypothetical protein
MTVAEAIAEIRKTGTIRAENGKLKLRFPEPERARLEPAIEVFQRDREAVLRALMGAETYSTTSPCTSAQKPVAEMANPTPETGTSCLKGQAVELWRDGNRFWVVADEEDAQETIRRFGARRGEIWTPGEIEFVARIPDQAIRGEIEALKRQLDGRLSPDAAGEGVSPAEWKAASLNRLFEEQGVRGEPGRITTATVRHGERKESK